MANVIAPTIASTPTTVDFATALLSMQAALSGVITDYNIGSQFRTQSESLGSVIETQGIATQAMALQSMVYGALSLFDVTIPQFSYATGVVTFATNFPVSAAPNVPYAIPIPSGTVVQSLGGLLFRTTASAVIASGTASVLAGVIAVSGGLTGNIPSLAISGTPVTSLGYPLYVQNANSFAGGNNTASIDTVIAAFTSQLQALGLSSPVAIANALIGLNVSGETCKYATVYEPWIAAGSGVGSGVAGFQLYIDNGNGSASSNLINAAKTLITGNYLTGSNGYRPAGVPYTVNAVTPVYATVVVSGSLNPAPISNYTVQNNIISTIQSYFNSLNFAQPALQGQIEADAANAGLGFFNSLNAYLYYTSNISSGVTSVTGAYNNRIILSSLTVNITQ